MNIVDEQCICTTPSHGIVPRRLSLSLLPSRSIKYIKPAMVEMEFDNITNHVVELLSCCDPKLLIRWCEGIMASEANKIKLFSGDFIKILKQLKTSLAIFKLQLVFDMESLLMEKFSITKHSLYLLAVEHNPARLYWMIPKSIVVIVDQNAHYINRFDSSLTFMDFKDQLRMVDLYIYPNCLYDFQSFITIKQVSQFA